MMILSWNCRGLGQPLTVKHLRRLVRRLCPGILFLMETKHDSFFMEEKQTSFNFANIFCVDSVNTAAGSQLVVDRGLRYLYFMF
ncbi:hypothetical protein LINGRAHAP2_LOCUS31256 [Linum grandiflorum]